MHQELCSHFFDINVLQLTVKERHIYICYVEKEITRKWTFYVLSPKRINPSKIYIWEEFYTTRYNSSCLRLKTLFKTYKNLHSTFVWLQFHNFFIKILRIKNQIPLRDKWLAKGKFKRSVNTIMQELKS